MNKFSLSFSTILVLNFGCEIRNFLKKNGESGRGRMTSNCNAFSLFGETKTFMYSSIKHDILNLHQPLFDFLKSKLHHLSMVKNFNFVCYYQVIRMKISTVVKFYYKGCN